MPHPPDFFFVKCLLTSREMEEGCLPSSKAIDLKDLPSLRAFSIIRRSDALRWLNERAIRKTPIIMTVKWGEGLNNNNPCTTKCDPTKNTKFAKVNATHRTQGGRIYFCNSRSRKILFFCTVLLCKRHDIICAGFWLFVVLPHLITLKGDISWHDLALYNPWFGL